jgi:hypothetical protein
MHATPRHSFCFHLYPVTRLHFLACLSNYGRSFTFPYLIFFCCFWLGCMRFPDQSTPRIGALALTTHLYLDHVPDCIAWRWQMFQSNFLFDVIPQAAWGGFCDTLFLWVVIFGHVRKYL